MNLPLSHSAERPNWRDFYRATILELDSSRLPERIVEADNVVIARARELFHQGGDNGEETENLNDAMYALRALRSTLRFFFFNVTATTKPNTLPPRDTLPN